MERTITVNGVGTAKAPVDYVNLNLTVESRAEQFSAASDLTEEKLRRLTEGFAALGFDAEALKTRNYEVQTVYESQPDAGGNYRSVFAGYRCAQGLQLGMDFSPELLSAVLDAVSKSGTDPELDLEFTVKEPEKLKKELLRAAAAHARATAETLCEASGAVLGALVSIRYDWGEQHPASATRFNTAMLAAKRSITPEDVRVQDAATFVWELSSDG